MGINSRLRFIVALGALSTALPALAHHSFAAEFDGTKPVSLTGHVTKLEWMNPHAYVFLDVEDEQTGEVVNWAVELGSPNGLRRIGWQRNSVKIGDLLTVEGSLARYRPRLANARSAVLTETGQRLGAASSERQR